MNRPQPPDNRNQNRDINLERGNYTESNLHDNARQAGRDYNETHIHKYSSDRPPTPQPQVRDKTQQLLLEAVEAEIHSRLHHSLHNRISIALDKEGDYSNVNPLWAIDVKIGINDSFELSPDTPIIDIYQRKDINGQLLILGEPGSGKTTTLLQLGQELIEQAKNDVTRPIPVFLNLSSWKDDRQTIEDWIINSFKQKSYRVSKDAAKELLDKYALIPF